MAFGAKAAKAAKSSQSNNSNQFNQARAKASTSNTTNTPNTSNQTQSNQSNQSNQNQQAKRRGVPPQGKNYAEYVREWRQTDRRDVNGNCAFCNLPSHGPPTCYYLMDEKPPWWRPSPEIWCWRPPRGNTPATNAAHLAAQVPEEYANAVLNFAGTALEHTEPPEQDDYEPDYAESDHRHVLDSGTTRTIAAVGANIVNYRQYTQDEKGFTFETAEGKYSRTDGEGRLVIRCRVGDTINELAIPCELHLRATTTLISTNQLAELGFHYNSRTNILEYEDRTPFGYT